MPSNIDYMELARLIVRDLWRSTLGHPKFFSLPASSSREQRPGNEHPASSPSVMFPQFMKLPAELRVKIWLFALEPRAHRIHLHPEHHHWYPSEEQESEDEEPHETEPADDIYGHLSMPRYGPRVRCKCSMTITPCSGSPCKCSSYEPWSPSALPLPAVLHVCSESRAVSLPRYQTCLNAEYDTRGCPKVHRLRQLSDQIKTVRPRTGLIFNPAVDAIILPVNVASALGVREIHHFAAIAVRQVPDLGKVIIELRIAMPPYRFWSTDRFSLWRNWGADGWWIPTKSLVQLRSLREVVFVRRKENKLLPGEWMDRVVSQWREEFLKVEEEWPVEWMGTMPSLQFIEEVENA